jgi:hypothetical protein
MNAVQVAAIRRLDRAFERDAEAIEPRSLAEVQEGNLRNAARRGR